METVIPTYHYAEAEKAISMLPDENTGANVGHSTHLNVPKDGQQEGQCHQTQIPPSLHLPKEHDIMRGFNDDRIHHQTDDRGEDAFRQVEEVLKEEECGEEDD